MIPDFLRSLAALIRHRIAAGQAVHVTEQTAKELELLAGLPLDQCQVIRETKVYKEQRARELNGEPLAREIPDEFVRGPATPADLALGWLIASKAMPSHGEIRYDTQCDRAAVCAELAVLISQLDMSSVVHVVEPEADVRQRWEKAVAEFGMGTIQLQPLDIQSYGVCPHEGTREGARAAWSFIVESELSTERGIELARAMGYQSIYPFVALAQEIGEAYRRELTNFT